MFKKAAATVAVALAVTVPAACSGGEEDTAPLETHTASDGTTFNDADVAFATGMIPHHAQALVMGDMTRGRDLDPEVQRLVEDIRNAQAPEIEQMVDWLTDWDQPIPATSRDHVNGGHGGEHGHDGSTDEMDEMDDLHDDMPGMMSADDLEELDAASDADFQRMWLEMMIEHHEGAVEMAETELDDGVSGPARKLASSIVKSQTAEIETMEGLLDS